jgi:staphylococcal nuclease domain-containing protein 1
MLSTIVKVLTFSPFRTAREKKAYLYANTGATASGGAGKAAGGAAAVDKRTFDGIVTRVWSGDQISVADKDTGKEKRLQLSSTRAFKTLWAQSGLFAHNCD